MHVSIYGLNMIKKFEGCRLKPYYCAAGVLTVGYGHVTTSKDTITQQQAEDFLKSDLVKFESRVKKATKKYGELLQWEFDAFVSFDFNTGAISRLVNNRDKNAAAKAMLQYVKAGGKVIDGLKERRQFEYNYFNCVNIEQVKRLLGYVDTGYVVGQTYQTVVGLKVRSGPGKQFKSLPTYTWTRDARKHDINPQNDCLDANTKVTCKGVQISGRDIWMKIPSGWICAVENGRVYVKEV